MIEADEVEFLCFYIRLAMLEADEVEFLLIESHFIPPLLCSLLVRDHDRCGSLW